MSQLTTTTTGTGTVAGSLARQATARSVTTITRLAIFAAVGGALVALLTSLFEVLEVQVPGWSFASDDALIVHFAGVPGVLAAAWAVLALRHLYERKWLFGGIVAGFFGLVLAVTTVVITTAGLQPQTAWVLGAVEALVAGLWIGDLFGLLRQSSVLPSLAGSAWLLIVTLLMMQPVLPFVFPVLVALLLTLPLLVAAVVSSKGKAGDQAALGWMLAGFFVIPLVAGTVMWVTRLLLPTH